MQVDEKIEPGACNWAVENSPAEVRSLQEADPVCVLSLSGSSAILNPNRQSSAYKFQELEHFG